VPPVNFENYWGVVVLSLLATMGILYRSDDHRGWVGFSVLLFGTFSAATFAFNQGVVARLSNPKEVLPLLATESPRVACNDLYLTTYLDLVHPRQSPTTFSWTRTLDLSTDSYLHTYLCDRKNLERSRPDAAPRFEGLFSTLDTGFISRGGDSFMSIGRQPIPSFPAHSDTTPVECIEHELFVVPTY